MKVLQINSVCGIGSTGRIATDIHAILNEQGHESYIAYGRGNAINCDTAIRIGNKYDNYIHVAKTRIFDKHGFGSKRATKKFIAEVNELNPDLIHLHNIHGYYINVEILFEYLKQIGKPIIWTLHDCWPFTGHCTYFEFTGCDCWRIEGNHRCIQKRSYPSSMLFNSSRSNFKRKRIAFTGVKNLTIVTPSKWLAELVKKSFLKEYPVKVINNGIDLDIFKPTKSNFRIKYNLEGKFIILGVASDWETRKGYKYFLEMSNTLSNDEKIVLVGLDESQINNLPNNIIGIKRTNSTKELAEIYSTADVFVNPTLEDNFPTTNIESLACGTPVITFETGGSGEIVDTNTGFIIPKGDTSSLWNAILKIKDTGKKKFSKMCVERSHQYYNKEINFNKYINLYNNESIS
ncbi:glycosyltransferase [Bacillus sp. MCCB 382]|uniref:glycosyltransferase n=1 Tax=Bacillus sp. MCCB 382 TaxID=2860197 RepID=UPI001C58A738|nr:glycosyltransferase [Bacillus sp. MCCB 382]